jgi:hypothetical protein
VQRASGIFSAFAGMEAELFECAQERTPARPSDSQSNPQILKRTDQTQLHPDEGHRPTCLGWARRLIVRRMVTTLIELLYP